MYAIKEYTKDGKYIGAATFSEDEAGDASRLFKRMTVSFPKQIVKIVSISFDEKGEVFEEILLKN